jgi:von Willebrand factor type A domain
VKTILSLVLSLVLLGLAGLAIKLANSERASRDAAALAAEESVAVHHSSRPGTTPNASQASPLSQRQPPPVDQNPFVPAGSNGRFNSFDAATDQVAAEIFDSCLDRPTLVVWLLDRTESASEMRYKVIHRLHDIYPRLDQFQFGPDSSGIPAESWLVSVVGIFGKEIEFRTPEPTADSRRVIEAISSISEDSSGEEQTFGAIAEAADRFGRVAAEEHRRLLIVVVTDEAGDDDQRVDELATILRKRGIALYVIGVPAPFGSRTSLAGLVQVEAFRPVRQGPESLEGEVLNLGGWQSEWQPIDSGFGPFAITRLALASGGRFLTVRPVATYDPATMATYEPDYLSRTAYDQLLQTNRARRALVDAARKSRIDLGGHLETKFRKKDEANLKKNLDEAQRTAARLEPKLQAMYALMETGVSDSAQLTEPRWRAGFDLALGRVAAGRARIEGYNAALAQMKGGRAFADPSHTTWVLQPTDDVHGDSSLEKLAEQARKCLNRVRSQHPDTPWATQAARELATPMGWQWVSQR